ncbi:hypothetical protein [Rubrivirga sp.]|uniref:hypothetical protein n=1 Tax=Rubrivirga sp. TaxID=1885344 RepID=UPI003C72717E
MDDSPQDGSRQAWFGRHDWRRSWLGPVLIGLAYGLMARLFFGLEVLETLFGIMTMSFIFLVPMVIGVIAVQWRAKESSWATAVFFPWVPTLLTIATTLVLAWEGLICAVVWVPISLVCASLGGVIGKVARSSRSPRGLAFALAALPVVFAPMENQMPDPVVSRTVLDSIVIEADPETVWREIREVRPIEDHELGNSLAYRIGFPRPIEARLEGEGVGSVRYATFGGGVVFIEDVTEWVENESIAFTIDASAVPSTTFDQHVAVGGRFFDVLSGRYEIEDLGDGRVALHLASEQRLATRFNPYTQIWTDRFMSDIQSTILEVVKARAEAV